MTTTMKAFERVGTGDPALDQLIDGGVPRGSVNVVAGEPGAGKTILALQTIFEAARDGKDCVYFTAVGEPPLKLFRYMERFSFYAADLLDRVQFVDLGDALRAGPPQALEAITGYLAATEPELVVFDTFRGIDELVQASGASRSFVFDLCSLLAGFGATTYLVGEYTDAEIFGSPVFGIADGVVRLGKQRVELTTIREIEIVKMRGTSFVPGRHFFEISSAGIRCFPRVRAPEHVDVRPTSPRDRDETGIAGLDAMLGGGFPRASATLVQGATGTGKTLLSLAWLMAGLQKGETGVFFALEETLDQLRGNAEGFGWDLPALERAGTLRMIYTSPVELSTDLFLESARVVLAQTRAKRAVFDSLTSMELGVPSQRRFRELVFALTKHARAFGTSLWMTAEAAEFMGSPLLASPTKVSFAADNIVQLRYLEKDGELARGITIVKARGMRHTTGMQALTIDERGIRVGP